MESSPNYSPNAQGYYPSRFPSNGRKKKKHANCSNYSSLLESDQSSNALEGTSQLSQTIYKRFTLQIFAHYKRCDGFRRKDKYESLEIHVRLLEGPF